MREPGDYVVIQRSGPVGNFDRPLRVAQVVQLIKETGPGIWTIRATEDAGGVIDPEGACAYLITHVIGTGSGSALRGAWKTRAGADAGRERVIRQYGLISQTR